MFIFHSARVIHEGRGNLTLEDDTTTTMSLSEGRGRRERGGRERENKRWGEKGERHAKKQTQGGWFKQEGISRWLPNGKERETGEFTRDAFSLYRRRTSRGKGASSAVCSAAEPSHALLETGLTSAAVAALAALLLSTGICKIGKSDKGKKG